MSLDQIESLLNSSTPEALREWNKINRATGMHTVVLFGIFNSYGADRLELAGTGTLVSINSSHYILTAAHVWVRCLKSAAKVGISLTENIAHRFLIDVATIVPQGPPWLGEFEWGPDIVYLRIPPAMVGTIKAYRVFYPLDVPSKVVSGSRVFESRLLEGTPAAYGVVKGAHGEVQVIGCVAWPIESNLKGEYDYIDVEAHLVKLAEGEDFGGVSGGGSGKC